MIGRRAGFRISLYLAWVLEQWFRWWGVLCEPSPATHPWPFNFILPELSLALQLAQGLHLLFPWMRRGLLNRSCLNLLKARRTFSGASTLPRGYISSFPGCTEGFVICSFLNSLKARRTFSGAPTLPRGYISSSPGCAEDFAICSGTKLAQGEEDFLWCPYFAQGLHLFFPRMRWGLCNLFLPELTRGWGGLSLFSPTLARSEEVFLISSRLHSLTARRNFLNLFSPDGDEN